MIDKASSIQDEFFNRARRDAHPVTIFLTNGKKLIGRIRSFDKFTVVVEVNRQEQMIFKHAISTVALGRPMPPGGARLESSAGAAAAEPDEAPAVAE